MNRRGVRTRAGLRALAWGRIAWGSMAWFGVIGCHADAPSRTFRAGDLTVHHVVAPAPIAVGEERDRSMSVYFTVVNAGATVDSLVRVETSAAGMAMLHETTTNADVSHMSMLDAVEVPAHGQLRLAPGRMHLMLEGLSQHIVVGDSLQLTLVFRRAGRLAVSAPIVAYSALDSLLDSARATR